MRRLFDVTSQTLAHCSECVYFCFGGEETATVILSPSEDGEHESVFLTEAVCLCLYMWPIVVLLQ